MSDQTNDNLLERAEEVMSYYEGTDLQTAIQNNLGTNDLDRVRQLVVNAEAEMLEEEAPSADTY